MDTKRITAAAGGCCVALYPAPDSQTASKMSRIMLQYRPIAPKPPVPTSAAIAGALYQPTGLFLAGVQPKRKSSSGHGRGRGRKQKKSPSTSKEPPVVTLRLLPETPETREDQPPPQACPAVVSWVTVESVTDVWSSGGGGDDEAVMTALAADTCPAFLSDAADVVTWTNRAYLKVAGGGGGGVSVGLVTRGMVPPCRAFTCRVQLRHACRRGGKAATLAAPCDVWRLTDGRWAWRVDVKAALSLSF